MKVLNSPVYSRATEAEHKLNDSRFFIDAGARPRTGATNYPVPASASSRATEERNTRCKAKNTPDLQHEIDRLYKGIDGNYLKTHRNG